MTTRPIEDRHELGEELYIHVLANTSKKLAGKITGMILELDIPEVKMLIASKTELLLRIEEALLVLHQEKEYAHIFESEPSLITPSRLLTIMINEIDSSPERWKELCGLLQSSEFLWEKVDHPLIKTIPEQMRNLDTVLEKFEIARNIRLLHNYLNEFNNFLNNSYEHSPSIILSEAYRISTLPKSNITTFNDYNASLKVIDSSCTIFGISPNSQSDRCGQFEFYSFSDLVLFHIWSHQNQTRDTLTFPNFMMLSLSLQNKRFFYNLVLLCIFLQLILLVFFAHFF
jgi:hypothetical protein